MFVIYNKMTGEEMDTAESFVECMEIVDAMNERSDFFEEYTYRFERDR